MKVVIPGRHKVANPPQIKLNGALRNVNADPQMPLLWVIRDILGLTGTKFGCGIGACGACTVHMDGQAVRSCIRGQRTGSITEGAQVHDW
jgi:aerobic-type carbon monoxide dehydrogenase small subunit (CoxS/CutS family)